MPAVGNIEKFDPTTDNFKSYASRLESFFRVNKVEDDQKVIHFYTMWGKEKKLMLCLKVC